MTARAMFDQLDESSRRQLLDTHRDINTDHDWWDSEYAEFKEDMCKIGIYVRNIYFSGFWSQGDGAMFEGHVDNWDSFLASLGMKQAALTKHARTHFDFYVDHVGPYAHEHCTEFEALLRLPSEYDSAEEFLEWHGTGEELHDAVMVAALSAFSTEDLEQRFTESFKDHMRALYRRLETEYEYLTSDEAVLDSLDANDLLEDAIIAITEEHENV